MESNRQVAMKMNHINEPRNSPPGSRTPRDWVKAAESISRPTVAGIGNGPAGSAWATCREVKRGQAGRPVMASKEDSTSGTTPAKGEAARAVAGVGVLHSSDDLRDTTTRGEPREGTYPNAMRRSEGSGDGSTGAISAHYDSAASIHAMSQSESDAQEWDSESRMRENRLSGLMRDGKQTVIGPRAS